MYDFLNYISEMVERYSWAIVPSIIGGLLAVFLLWGRVPKVKLATIKNAISKRIPPGRDFLILSIAYLLISLGSIFLLSHSDWWKLFPFVAGPYIGITIALALLRL